MKYKYIILDFGKVIAGPVTGNWNITKKFMELVNQDEYTSDEYKRLRNKYSHILSEKVTTLDEQYNMFYRFYDGILSELNISNYSKELVEEIARDRSDNYDNYFLYENIYEELKSLKEKYKLILLTDNWPWVLDYLKTKNLYSFFDKIYVSSIYGVEKKDKVFFDYPINDFNIKKGEALFIDDNETNLDIASDKGLDVMLMDRDKLIENSKYKIINDLFF